MSIAAPMLVISLIIYAGLFGLFIYLVILIIRALKKYIRSKDVRAEKSFLNQNLGEVYLGFLSRGGIRHRLQTVLLSVR